MQRTVLAASAIIALSAGAATAETSQKASSSQDMQGQQAATSDQQVARQCLDDLHQLGQKMRDDGFWLTGYRSPSNYWGAYGPMGPGAAGYGAGPPPASTTGDSAQQAPQSQAADTGETTQPAQAAQPWGNVEWRVTPGWQIRTLYSAANVLGQQGDQQTCEAVSGKLRQLYQHYVEQLREADVEPGAVTSWRERQLVGAAPVTELGTVRINNVIGTDVWNGNDQQLGSVDDVVMSQRSGKIAYVVVAYGGFLGIGDSYVPVPWEQFKATPGLNVLVLDADQDTLAKAPQATPAQIAQSDPESGIRDRVRSYWQQVGSDAG